MSKRQESLPTPHAGQRKFLSLPGRFKIAVCGRRYGKNVMGGIAALEAARAGDQVAWIEPTDEQTDQVHDELREHINANVKTKTTPKGDWTITAKTFKHKSGGRIRLRSAFKGDTLRGPGLDLVVIDEAADVDERTWQKIILPQLLERDGKAILLGTPRGKGNWLHRVFEHAAADPKWSRMHAPTSTSPLITLKQLNAMRSEMTDIDFRQEFEAEFIDSNTSVFPGVEDHVRGEPRGDGITNQKYATGIDLGQTAFCVCISVDPRTNIARAITRWNRAPWAVNEARVRAHLKRFPGPALIDATGVGSMPAENLDDIARPFVFNDETRTRLIRQLAVAWEAERIYICNHPILMHELRCMEWRQEGTPPHSHLVARTTGEYCDCVMALALAWDARQRLGDDNKRPGQQWSF